MTVEVAPGVLEYDDTTTPGIYRVAYRDGDGEVVRSQIATRQFVAAESAMPARPIATELDETGTLDEAAVLREWAPLILAALLGIVMVEWWVAYGRPWPRRKEVAA